MSYIKRIEEIIIEISDSYSAGTKFADTFKVLDSGNVPRDVGATLCTKEEFSAVDRSTLIVPIWMI